MYNAIKFLFSFAIVSIFISQTVSAQDKEMGPLAGSEAIRQSAEIIMIWSDTISSSDSRKISYQKIYDYLDIDNVPINQKLTVNDLHSAGDSMLVSGNGFMYVATGNFNDDEFDDIVAAWSGPDSTINIILPLIDEDNLNWQDASRLVINGVGTSRILLKTGDFDSDGLDEFLIAYTADTTIHIEIYDTDGGFEPSLVGAINDELSKTYIINNNLNDFRSFSIELGDFDGDDDQELVLAGIEPTEDSTWIIYGKIYNVSESGNITASIKETIYEFDTCLTCPDFRYDSIDVAVSTGSFDDFYDDEMVFSFNYTFRKSESPYEIIDSSYFIIARSNDELTEIEVNDAGAIKLKRNRTSIVINSGDLNNDGSDEIINNSGGLVEVYQSDNNMNLSLLTSNTFFTEYEGTPSFTYQNMDIGDVDGDGNAEIVIVENYWRDYIDANDPQRFNLFLVEFNDSLGTLELKAELQGEEPTGGFGNSTDRRHFAIAFGDFDGDRLRFGKPTRYTDTEIRQPLVVLNSPPVHFDVIDNQIFDINTCFNSNNCEFYATYEKQVSTTIEVSTEVKQTWSTDSSQGFEGSGSLGNEGGSIEKKIDQNITNKYGENFTNSRRKAETIKIRVKALAQNEDQIYATVTDYDTWEYPVYQSDEFIGYIVVVVPTVTQHRWFPSKSWTGLKYLPSHEVGNILSYLEYSDLSNNEYVAESIKVNKGDGFTLGPSSDFNWTLEFSEFSEYGAKDEYTIGLEVGEGEETTVSAGAILKSISAKISAKSKSSYKNSEGETRISTHSTKIQEDLSISVKLGSIFSTGDEYYTVTPYSYWSVNGALVLDYTAVPVLAPPGYPLTWWQRTYGEYPDPAFMLPWNLDVEKGLSIDDYRKKYLTREILLEPDHPELGDTITTTIRIHNFSLIPLDDSVSVRLYLGDPDLGGTLITGINGETQMLTPEFMKARDRAVVQMKWILPTDVEVERYARVYAVIDEEDNVTEIHEDNNKAFAILGNQEGQIITSVGDDLLSSLPETFVLFQNYPNPFNPTTIIQYSLPSKSDVMISVYNILGQKINTLLNSSMPAGMHSVEWDGTKDNGGNVSSGVYLYKLETNEFVSSKKMLLIK